MERCVWKPTEYCHLVETENTEERDKMCEYWGKYAYSKVYLMYWSYDPTSDKNYWYKEEVYWTGWEWNEENNHLHGIGTKRNINNEDEEQKSHMVFDLGFIHIISEKKLKEIKKELLRVQESLGYNIPEASLNSLVSSCQGLSLERIRRVLSKIIATYKEINIERTDDAIETAAEVIATGCPFCNTMMTDGIKNAEKEETVKVLDIAELIANAAEL